MFLHNQSIRSLLSIELVIYNLFHAHHQASTPLCHHSTTIIIIIVSLQKSPNQVLSAAKFRTWRPGLSASFMLLLSSGNIQTRTKHPTKVAITMKPNKKTLWLNGLFCKQLCWWLHWRWYDDFSHPAVGPVDWRFADIRWQHHQCPQQRFTAGYVL